MSHQNDEIERAKRIRDRQLRLRDPKARDKKLMQKISADYDRKRKSLTLQDVLKDIPGKWWGMIIGGIVGSIAALVLSTKLESSWAPYLGYIILFACVVLGRGVGMTMDWREEDHDKLVRRR